MLLEGDIVITKEKGICKVTMDYDDTFYLLGMVIPTDKGTVIAPDIIEHILENKMSDSDIMKEYAEYCI